VFLTAFETGSEARTASDAGSINNTDRQNSTFNGRTPDKVCAMQESEEKLAAYPESILALPPMNRDHL
jgi:hypothetical protein